MSEEMALKPAAFQVRRRGDVGLFVLPELHRGHQLFELGERSSTAELRVVGLSLGDGARS